MRYITKKAWQRYVDALRAINDKAAKEVEDWIYTFGVDENGNMLPNIMEATDKWDQDFIEYCYYVSEEYGNASAALSAQMYDLIAELEGAVVPAAEMAETATYNDVAKTVQGVLKTSRNVNEMSGAVSRLVKKAGCDTTLQNAYRDRAQYAWIPSGDTCAFCLALASNGWVNISERRAKKGYPHAEHIHSNCNCTYAIRFDSNTNIAGYDPDKYDDMFRDANEAAEKEGYDSGWNNMDPESVNNLRRQLYAQNKKKIDSEYSGEEKSRMLNKSAAEEIKVN